MLPLSLLFPGAHHAEKSERSREKAVGRTFVGEGATKGDGRPARHEGGGGTFVFTHPHQAQAFSNHCLSRLNCPASNSNSCEGHYRLRPTPSFSTINLSRLSDPIAEYHRLITPPSNTIARHPRRARRGCAGHDKRKPRQLTWQRTRNGNGTRPGWSTAWRRCATLFLPSPARGRHSFRSIQQPINAEEYVGGTNAPRPPPRFSVFVWWHRRGSLSFLHPQSSCL